MRTLFDSAQLSSEAGWHLVGMGSQRTQKPIKSNRRNIKILKKKKKKNLWVAVCNKTLAVVKESDNFSREKVPFQQLNLINVHTISQFDLITLNYALIELHSRDLTLRYQFGIDIDFLQIFLCVNLCEFGRIDGDVVSVCRWWVKRGHPTPQRIAIVSLHRFNLNSIMLLDLMMIR